MNNILNVLVIFGWLASATGSAYGMPVSLAPVQSGVFVNGDGANSAWVQLKADWRGPTYGAEYWGTGIWSLADAAIVQNLTSANSFVLQTHAGGVQQIDFGNHIYNTVRGSAFGVGLLPPIFSSGQSYQENYAALFSGFIAVTSPGLYNFGVLVDDGFLLNLFGQTGPVYTLQLDGLQPPTFSRFADEFFLQPGLYGYTLESYNRLEAGIVRLSWQLSGSDWQPIPQSHLFTHAIPEPAGIALVLAGLLTLGAYRLAIRRRQKSNPSVPAA